MSVRLRMILSSLSYMLANSFAITSIGTTSWVINNFSGITRIGLTKICVLFKDQPLESERCEPLQLPSHWAVTLVFIVIGICLSFLTVLLLLLAMWGSVDAKKPRIMGCMSMLFLCVAAVIFPFGFTIKEVGGEAYKLPEHTEVGYSYFFFCGSILLLTTAVGLSNYRADGTRALGPRPR